MKHIKLIFVIALISLLAGCVADKTTSNHSDNNSVHHISKPDMQHVISKPHHNPLLASRLEKQKQINTYYQDTKPNASASPKDIRCRAKNVKNHSNTDCY